MRPSASWRPAATLAESSTAVYSGASTIASHHMQGELQHTVSYAKRVQHAGIRVTAWMPDEKALVVKGGGAHAQPCCVCSPPPLHVQRRSPGSFAARGHFLTGGGLQLSWVVVGCNGKGAPGSHSSVFDNDLLPGCRRRRLPATISQHIAEPLSEENWLYRSSSKHVPAIIR